MLTRLCIQFTINTMRSKKKNYWGLKVFGVTVLVAAIAFCAAIVLGGTELAMEPAIEEKVTTEVGKSWTHEEPKAYVMRRFLPFIKKEIPLKVTGKVDTEKIGSYKLTYEASYQGETLKEIQTVTVKDMTKPVLKLTGDPTYKTIYKATDNTDGDITDKVEVKRDKGTLIYSVKDSSGNKTVLKRETPYEPTEPSGGLPFTESEKTIYLTFDDGPSAYTEELLEILDKYGIKATFFTTSAYPDYADMMKKASQSGHTVAVHTTTHNYDQIYKSESAFWKDHDNQQEVIKEETGKVINIFRFPGGSSNNVSKSINAGIMTRLVKEAEQKGLEYYDWNVSSGDGGGTQETDQVFLNVIDGITRNSKKGVPNIVLQHDTHQFSVNAVERIIVWGLDNGYEFQPIMEGSYAPHHGTVN